MGGVESYRTSFANQYHYHQTQSFRRPSCIPLPALSKLSHSHQIPHPGRASTGRSCTIVPCTVVLMVEVLNCTVETSVVTSTVWVTPPTLRAAFTVTSPAVSTVTFSCTYLSNPAACTVTL